VKVAFVVAALLCCDCVSAGDVLVPAHRTRDGSYVPANVSPNSSGSYLARRPGKGIGKRAGQPRAANAPLVPPLLANAQPIRR
jgi:hypothetical protein